MWMCVIPFSGFIDNPWIFMAEIISVYGRDESPKWVRGLTENVLGKREKYADRTIKRRITEKYFIDGWSDGNLL